MGQALEMCVHCENKRGCDTCTDLHNWIMEHLEPKQEWISVKDRLPEAEYGESNSVLTISELGAQGVLYFDGGCWCYPTGEVRDSDFHITHWMPLPEPPKDGE